MVKFASSKTSNCRLIPGQSERKLAMIHTRHWTTGSPDKFAYAVASDFVAQLEIKLEAEGMEKKDFARRAGVSPSFVSQVLNNPGNLGVKTMAKFALALGMKVAVVAYEDGDPGNDNGPISASVFNACWNRERQPHDLFDVAKSSVEIGIQGIHLVGPRQPLVTGNRLSQNISELVSCLLKAPHLRRQQDRKPPRFVEIRAQIQAGVTQSPQAENNYGTN